MFFRTILGAELLQALETVSKENEMGDGFSDARREEREANEHYYKMDSFFALILSAATQTTGDDAKKLLRKDIAEWDTYIYRNACSLQHKRRSTRIRAWMQCIEDMKAKDRIAWATVLTESLMRASETASKAIHEYSPFSGSPVMVLVPHGTYRDPTILGDYRQVHDLLNAGSLPFTCTVKMPERAVKGIQGNGVSAKEIRERGFDDVRFISF